MKTEPASSNLGRDKFDQHIIRHSCHNVLALTLTSPNDV